MAGSEPSTPLSTDLWHLGAHPQSLRDCAVLWRGLGEGASRTAGRVDAAAQGLLQRWSGSSADAYRPHYRQVVRGYTAVTSVSTRVADLMESGAALLSTSQEHLDDAWTRLRRRLPGQMLTSASRILYDATDADQVSTVSAAVREALAIRADADRGLATLAVEVDRARRDLWPHSHLARHAAEVDAWTVPADPTTPGLIVAGGRVIVSGTGGADVIAVHVDRHTGEQIVVVNGVEHRLAAAADVLVRAGAGNDTITVEPGARVRMTLLGGAGDDRIAGGAGDETVLGLWGLDTVQGGGGADRLLGGADRDYLDGQAGGDLLVGGSGDDVLYGLDGTDRLWGGDGRDYLDGGAGLDVLAGGFDNDMLLGGRDGDVVLGGAGDDALYGGGGPDLIHGGAGTDRSYRQPGDAVFAVDRDVTVELTDVGGFIRVEGSPEFVARVQSDLDALRSSPRGAQMLAALQSSHEQSRSGAADLPLVGALFESTNTLVIRETTMPNGFAGRTDLTGGPVSGVIGYNPTFDDLSRNPPAPPVVVLYHELAHIYDHFHATMAGGVYQGSDNPGVPNLEREATGLPIDHDGDPASPDQLHPDHPWELTENGLREEFGLDRRTRY